MTKEDLIALARQKASEHGLDGNLVCAIIEQESAWNPWAVRYEPKFMSKYIAPMYTAGRISATEAYSRSFSWGLMQVMGQVARETGYSLNTLSELCDPAIGIEFGCQVFAKRMERAKGNESAALLAWNGGGNPDYPDEVLKRVATYSA